MIVADKCNESELKLNANHANSEIIFYVGDESRSHPPKIVFGKIK